MAEKTEAQKRAQKAYMDKFVRVEVRMSPEKYESVKEHAKLLDKGSVAAFINRAIDETIPRDRDFADESLSDEPVHSDD